MSIVKNIVFPEMLQRNDALRKELIRSARPDELKSILELCLNMKEGNLKLPRKNSHRSIIMTLANRKISLTDKRNWMLRFDRILSDILNLTIKEWKTKFNFGK